MESLIPWEVMKPFVFSSLFISLFNIFYDSRLFLLSSPDHQSSYKQVDAPSYYSNPGIYFKYSFVSASDEPYG